MRIQAGTARHKTENYQLPITKYQVPITNYQVPISDWGGAHEIKDEDNLKKAVDAG